MRSVRLTRGRVGAATVAVAGITSAVTMLALDAPAGAETSQNWASAVAADGTVLNVPATPYASSTGSLVDKSLAAVPSNPAVSAQALRASADAAGARASLADLNVASGQIKAGLIEATCQGGAGDAKLVDAVIGGQQVPVSVAPNTTIALPPGSPLTSVVLNKQVPDGHGGTTVTAVAVSLKLPAAPVAQNVNISTADCAGSTGSAPPPSAPAPKPKQGNLSVTG